MSRPDEGMIHAWLDGELDAGESKRIEQLVATDPEWAAAAAEARGLVAASSRILGALDSVPAKVAPKARPVAKRTALSVDPTRHRARHPLIEFVTSRQAVAMAATLLLAVGSYWAAKAAKLVPAGAGPVLITATREPVAPPAVESRIAQAPTAPAPTARAGAESDRAPALADAPPKAIAADPRQGGAQLGIGQLPATQQQMQPSQQQLAQLSVASPPVRLDSAANLLARKEEAKASTAAPAVGALQEKATASARDAAGNRPLPPASAFRAEASNRAGFSASGAGAAAADMRIVMNVQCFREPDAAGVPGILHKINRIGDSTAVASPNPSDPDTTIAAARRARNGSALTYRVRGETLFVPIAGAAARIALRTTCPAP